VAHAPSEVEAKQPELEPIGNSAPTTFGVKQPEVLGEFVADLESSLGDDFLKGAPVVEPETAPEVEAVAQAGVEIESLAESKIENTSRCCGCAAKLRHRRLKFRGGKRGGGHRHLPAFPQFRNRRQPPLRRRCLERPSRNVRPAHPRPSLLRFGEDAGVDLAEMFGELKQELESRKHNHRRGSGDALQSGHRLPRNGIAR